MCKGIKDIYMFCFKTENNFPKPTGQYGGGGEQSYKRGLRTSPWEQRTNRIQKITTNAPKWGRSLQRTDCPHPQTGFLFGLFFISFFCCCYCFSTCAIKLYHLQPEPATARCILPTRIVWKHSDWY